LVIFLGIDGNVVYHKNPLLSIIISYNII